MPYKDPERRREYGREWMERNAGKAREGMRRWRARHPEQKKQQHAEYYRLNRLAILSKVSVYARVHPEVGRAKHHRRRARQLGGGGSFTAREWLALVEAFGGRCAYCGAAGPVTVDHRVPVHRGGSSWIENILPACRVCNQRKFTMTEEEFRERLRREAAGEPFAAPDT